MSGSVAAVHATVRKLELKLILLISPPFTPALRWILYAGKKDACRINNGARPNRVKPRNSGPHCNGNLALMDHLTRPARSPYTPYVKGFPCSGSLYNGNLALVEKNSVPQAFLGTFYNGFDQFTNGEVGR